jgi:ribosomal RNA-processing protein 9
VYSGSKDNSVVRWDVESGAKAGVLRPKWSRKTHPDTQASAGEVLSVAVSTDGRYVVSGGRDGLVRVYDSRTNSEIKAMAGHRDAVTSVAFRRESYSLFTGSLDRCVKHWDLNEMGYIESAFGHQVMTFGHKFDVPDCMHRSKHSRNTPPGIDVFN